jgi:putative transposase
MNKDQSNKFLFDPDKVNEALKSAKSMDDLFAEGGALQLMLKNSMETMLKAELEDHLGYPHRGSKSKDTSNSRNGSYKKSVKTTSGKLNLDIPRDREGTFEPKAIPKYEGVSSKLEEQIISMYAKGMTTRDIESHVKEIYFGLEISPTAISSITEKILDHAKEWQSRPLNELYPVVFFDAIHYKVRVDGKVICKAAYTCLGIDKNGLKDVLGIYIGENESSTFWLSVLTDLQNRGIQDILIACVDGLKGFPEAIASIFPKTEVQTCIVHQIRNSLKYVGSKHQKDFMNDLKLVYQAATEEVALKNLDALGEKWGEKYPVVVNSWKNNWSTLSNYFKYSQPIRKIIYTTNIVENLHRQMRKVTKNRAVFPTDDSLFKLLYLAVKDVSVKWTTPKWNWGQVIAQLSIHFEGRVELDLI